MRMLDRTLRPLLVVWLGVGACGDDEAMAGSATDTDGDTGSTGSPSTTSPSTTSPSTSAATGSTTTMPSTSSTEGDMETTGTTIVFTSSGTEGETDASSSTTQDDSTSSGSSSSGGSSSSSSSGGGSSSSSSGTDTGDPDAVPAFAGMGLPDEYVVFDVVGETVLEGPTSLLPEANYPYDATIRPDGAEVWFVGASGDGFVVVDPTSYDILHQATLTAGQYAVDVLFSADSTLAYIANRDTDDVTVLDTSDYSEIEDIATPGGLQAGKMALNPCTGHIYVVEWYGDELMTYDPEADSWDSVDIGVASLWDLVVDSGGSTLYVTDRGNDEVHIFDVSATGVPGNAPDDSVAVGDDPWGIDITSDGNTVVVACEDDYTVHFIDVATLGTTSLDLPQSEPRDVDISADDSLAYVPTGETDSDEDGMFVVDIASETLLSTISLGSSDTNVVAVAPQAATCVE